MPGVIDVSGMVIVIHVVCMRVVSHCRMRVDVPSMGSFFYHLTVQSFVFAHRRVSFRLSFLMIRMFAVMRWVMMSVLIVFAHNTLRSSFSDS